MVEKCWFELDRSGTMIVEEPKHKSSSEDSSHDSVSQIDKQMELHTKNLTEIVQKLIAKNIP